MHTPSDSELGKATVYPKTYDKSVLFSIPRLANRKELGLAEKTPFFGVDIWNAWEVSWLNAKGKPQVAIAQFSIPCESTFIVESKSLKLYLNSFNGTKMPSLKAVEQRIATDLSEAAGGPVQAALFELENFDHQIHKPHGICLDALDIEVDSFSYDESLLKLANDQQVVEESLYSHLLKSNCPVTNQPDWATVSVHYKGRKLDHQSLLRYILSFREHNEFHEQCVERMFMTIQRLAHCSELKVEARYTRRGGLDINPTRTLNPQLSYLNSRFIRQ